MARWFVLGEVLFRSTRRTLQRKRERPSKIPFACSRVACGEEGRGRSSLQNETAGPHVSSLKQPNYEHKEPTSPRLSVRYLSLGTRFWRNITSTRMEWYLSLFTLKYMPLTGTSNILNTYNKKTIFLLQVKNIESGIDD